jgi:hypothetical protein
LKYTLFSLSFNISSFSKIQYTKNSYIFKMLGIAGTRESGQDVREENGR